MSDRHIGQLKADIKSGEMSVQMYQQQTELTDQALQSECDVDVYEMYQRCEDGDTEAVGVVDVKEKGRIDRITFREDTEKLSRTLEDLHLGEIHVQYDNVLDLKAAPVLQDTTNVLDLKAAPVLQDTINVLDLKAAPVLQDTTNVLDLKAAPVLQDITNVVDLKAAPVLQDTITVNVAGGGNPIDVTVLEVNGKDTMVVTDKNDNRVKSFYTRSSQLCHSKLSLEGRPYGITRLTHNQVAVTVLYTRQIVTVEVNPDLVLLSTITTSKQYWGITSLTPSTLAAGSLSRASVDILDLSGHVLKSVCPSHKGGNILKCPNFLCTTRTGNILVSDCGTRCVVCLTLEGDVVFNYRPTGNTAMEYPRGITSTSTGDILVTDSSQHRVIHLTESGQFVRNILTSQDSIENPWGLCVDGRGRMYLCTSAVVKVFTCCK